jgi:hypothetical protein
MLFEQTVFAGYLAGVVVGSAVSLTLYRFSIRKGFLKDEDPKPLSAATEAAIEPSLG